MRNKQSGFSRRSVLRTGLVAGAVAGTVMGFPAIVRSQQAKKLLKPIVAGLSGKLGDPTVDAIAMIPKILREKYDVEVDIQVHPAAALASDLGALEAVQTGFIDITSHGSAWLQFSDAFAVADLPYVFTDWDNVMRFFRSDLHKQMAAKMEKDIPVKVLPSVAGGGFRWLLNNRRELRTPKDVQGMRMRTVPSPILTELLRAWNASPTPMAFPETYTALQQGVINGDHFQPIWMYQFNFHEVAKFATETKAVFGFAVQVLNINAFKAMPEAIQKPFMLAAQDAADLANAKDRELEANYKKLNAEKGVKIYTPTEAEMKEWRDPALAVWEKSGVAKSIIDATVALQRSA